MEMMDDGSCTARHAARRLICTDFENPDASLTRDRQNLTEASSLFTTRFDREK